MSIRTSASNLAQAAKELSLRWEETREQWRDAKSREFAEEYLDELPSRISQTLVAMEDIEKILKKVREDCE